MSRDDRGRFLPGNTPAPKRRQVDGDRNRRAVRARGRALTKLAELHRVEFRRLLDEERRKEDLPPSISAR